MADPITSFLFQQALGEMMDRTGLKERGAKFLTGLLGMGEAQASEDTSGAPAAGFAPVQPQEPFVSPSMTRQGPQVELMTQFPRMQITPPGGDFTGPVQNMPLSETQVLNLPSRDVMEVDLTRPMYNRPAESLPVTQQSMEADEEALQTASDLAQMGIKTPQQAGIAASQDPGVFSKIKNYLNDEESMYRLAMAFNTMRTRPDAGISQFAAEQLKTIRGTRQANRTADYLESIGQKQAADLVRLGLPAKDVIGAGKQFDVGSGSEFAKKYGITGLEPTKPYKRNIQTGEVSQIGGGGTNVDINMKAETKYAEEVRKNFAESETKLYQTAVAAPAQLEKLYETRSLIEQGDPQTGAFAELSKNIQRVRSKLFDSETAQIKVADTELLNSLLGSDVFGMIGALGIGARGLDTPAEREFLREVMTGTISLDKETLLRMLDIRENVQRRAIQSYNDAVMGGELDDFFEASRKKKRTIRIPQYSPRPIFSQRQEQEIQSGGTQRIGNTIIRQVGQ